MTQSHEYLTTDETAEVARLSVAYEAAVEQGDLEEARHARATLSDFLESLAQSAPETEEQLRKDLKFPMRSPGA